jgi:hypothetical protein
VLQTAEGAGRDAEDLVAEVLGRGPTGRAPGAAMPEVAAEYPRKARVRGSLDNSKAPRQISRRKARSRVRPFRTRLSRPRKTANRPWPMRPTRPPAALRI